MLATTFGRVKQFLSNLEKALIALAVLLMPSSCHVVVPM
jgi:hypothetical protein